MSRHIVARADEIPPGGRKIVEVAGRSVGVFNVGGEFLAIRNRCPHQGAPLCEGRLWGALTATAPGAYAYSRGGEILACLWHGWEFDLRTGQSLCDPQRLRVRRYPAAVESAPDTDTDVSAGTGAEGERVPGPYRAETYPAATEGEYVVIELIPNVREGGGDACVSA